MVKKKARKSGATEIYDCLMISDVHMSNSLPFAKPCSPDGITDRLQGQRELWSKVRELALDQGISDVWVLGDLFDKALLDAITLHATIESLVSLERAGLNLFILPGNHDANNIRGDRFTVEAFKAMERERIRLLTADAFEIRKGLDFWTLPFAPVEENRKALEGFKKEMDPDSCNVLLMHNSVIGSKHLGWVCDDGLKPEELCESFGYVLSGHFHTPQAFGENGFYLGGALQFNFGDEGEKRGFWRMTFSDEGGEIKLKRRLIDSGLPRFFVSHDYEAIPEGIKEGDYLRLVVEATGAEWKGLQRIVAERCKELEKRGIKARFKHKPVYHHKTRLKETESEALNLTVLIGDYVDAAVADGLDKKFLKKLGREILSEIEKAES